MPGPHPGLEAAASSMPAPFWSLLGWALFQSTTTIKLYRSFVLSKWRWLRLIGHAALVFLFTLRTARRFSRSLVHFTAVLALVLAESAAFLAPHLLLLVPALAAVALVVVVAGQLEGDETGHRAGAEDYDGVHCENTIEALLDLVRREQQFGPLPNFPYLELDVNETADGQLVVFHDASLTRAFPCEGANAAAAAQLEEETGQTFELLTVQDLSFAQLQSLCIAGRPGLRVPTLRRFLEACTAAKVNRPLAVEAKVVLTDAARQEFIDLISAYLHKRGQELHQDPTAAKHVHRDLGWAGVLAFPHHFAKSFGEFGSPQWQRWAAEFKRCGIPVRCCHVTWMSLIG